MLALVLYLRRRDTGPAAAWWAEVERYASAAPGIVRELLRESSVICAIEAERALAWARAHPTWVDEPAPPGEVVGTGGFGHFRQPSSCLPRGARGGPASSSKSSAASS
jgi:hypothetical protein